MADLTIARAIHILSIVIWMGGVAFVTMVCPHFPMRLLRGESISLLLVQRSL